MDDETYQQLRLLTLEMRAGFAEIKASLAELRQQLAAVRAAIHNTDEGDAR